jgi:hypothetical protein
MHGRHGINPQISQVYSWKMAQGGDLLLVPVILRYNDPDTILPPHFEIYQSEVLGTVDNLCE